METRGARSNIARSSCLPLDSAPSTVPQRERTEGPPMHREPVTALHDLTASPVVRTCKLERTRYDQAL